MKTLPFAAVPPASPETSLPRRSMCKVAVGAAAFAALAGCGMFAKKPPPVAPAAAAPPPPPAAPPPRPGTLSISIAASLNINPNASRRPSPVVVRVYELKAAAAFETADFLSLYEKDQSVLGADIVARDEMVLAPGDRKLTNKALAADTKFIGVVAAFRDLERARWRALVPVQPNKNNQVSVDLDGIAVVTAVASA